MAHVAHPVGIPQTALWRTRPDSPERLLLEREAQDLRHGARQDRRRMVAPSAQGIRVGRDRDQHRPGGDHPLPGEHLPQLPAQGTADVDCRGELEAVDGPAQVTLEEPQRPHGPEGRRVAEASIAETAAGRATVQHRDAAPAAEGDCDPGQAPQTVRAQAHRAGPVAACAPRGKEERGEAAEDTERPLTPGPSTASPAASAPSPPRVRHILLIGRGGEISGGSTARLRSPLPRSSGSAAAPG